MQLGASDETQVLNGPGFLDEDSKGWNSCGRWGPAMSYFLKAFIHSFIHMTNFFEHRVSQVLNAVPGPLVNKLELYISGIVSGLEWGRGGCQAREALQGSSLGGRSWVCHLVMSCHLISSTTWPVLGAGTLEVLPAEGRAPTRGPHPGLQSLV